MLGGKPVAVPFQTFRLLDFPFEINAHSDYEICCVVDAQYFFVVVVFFLFFLAVLSVLYVSHKLNLLAPELFFKF